MTEMANVDGWDYSEYGLDERGEGEQYEVLAMDTVKLLEADDNLDLDAVMIDPGSFRLAGQRMG